MRRAAIVAPIRTPSGIEGGALSGMPPHWLASTVLAAVLERSGIDPPRIENVALAGLDGSPAGALELSELAVHGAGLPSSVPGFLTDQRRGSGLPAVLTAAMMVQTGAADVVVAGGVECAADNAGRQWNSAGPADVLNAEQLARRYGIGRAEADEFAVASHRKAARAWRQGRFAAEVIPVGVVDESGRAGLEGTGGHRILRDEGLLDDVSTYTLAALRPLLANGVVTTGNMSAHRHGAAACLVVAEDRLAEFGLTPMAYLVGWATAGCASEPAALGAAPAVAKLLGRTGITLDDIDLVEVNEGFAVEVLALAREWDLDPRDRLNVNGSAIALGHPVGATGLRIMTTMLHELARRGGGLGLEVMTLGHHHGIAALFESAGSDPVTEAPRGARFHGARPARRFGRHRA
ncbi:acetyl-CoA C-acetyltransferase [Nocardia tenerifensis]|uniref:Acetyl-CoA C-acetyltransferase n=1 Tax=Nocardia tenerifensis TaxID=228006 RepID=A0A318K2A9_9NOCA|nr:acetyl-CoA C-acyltransferase [Nocardia tenerifensis]PXX65624.1 acetyl-CoA C-acetyltransferase [Nocardia tenerifensis]